MTCAAGSATRVRALWLALCVVCSGVACAGDDAPEDPLGHAPDSPAVSADAATDGGVPSDAAVPSSSDAARADASTLDGASGADAAPRDAAAGNDDSAVGRDAGSTPGRAPDASQNPALDGGAPAADAGSFPALSENVTLHVAGDSTAASYPASDATRRVGWASVLQQFFVAGVRLNDAAQSGRSSKSFIDEGLWSALKAKVRSGDYVFIQFGHNDEKMEDATRYTDAATTYRTYLKTYVSETRAAGGVPVLLTPISRRQFSGGKIVASHGNYPAAVVAVGKETGTPVIDMTEKTRMWLEGLGSAATIPMFATDDNTHLSATGALEVAKLAVQGLRELGLPLAQRLVP